MLTSRRGFISGNELHSSSLRVLCGGRKVEKETCMLPGNKKIFVSGLYREMYYLKLTLNYGENYWPDIFESRCLLFVSRANKFCH